MNIIRYIMNIFYSLLIYTFQVYFDVSGDVNSTLFLRVFDREYVCVVFNMG